MQSYIKSVQLPIGIFLFLFLSLSKGIFTDSLMAQTPDVGFDWAKLFVNEGIGVNNSGGGSPHSIVLDNIGNIYVAGRFYGSIDFDPGPGVFNLTSEGSIDAKTFIVKLSPIGDFIWAKAIGTEGIFGGIAVDDNNNVFITGGFAGTVNFGGIILTAIGAGRDVYVCKFNTNGTLIWVKQMGGDNGHDSGRAIDVDNNGNIITAGKVTLVGDFDPGPNEFLLTPNTAHGNQFISKLDNNGNFVWAQIITDVVPGSINVVNSIAVDNVNNVLLTGYFRGQIDFDPGAAVFELSSASESQDIFITKLSSSGSFVWAKRIGGDEDDYGISLDVDNLGNVYTGGENGVLTDFDPGSGEFIIESSGIFLSKLNSQGNFVWSKGIEDEDGGAPLSSITFNSVSIDALDNPYFAGSFHAHGDTYIDFDPGSGVYPLQGGDHSFICKLTDEGDFEWVKRTTSEPGGLSFAKTLVLDDVGNIYYAGNMKHTVDFNTGIGEFLLSGIGNIQTIFVSKLQFCYSTQTSIDTTVCGSYASPNGTIFDDAGTYNFSQIITNEGGCDDVFNILLNIIEIPTVVSQTGGLSCGPGTAMLTAIPNFGTIEWYTSETGGNPIGTGNNFNTPFISETTTFYAGALNNGCASINRSPIIATVYTVPSITSTTGDERCGEGTVSLSAIPNEGIAWWYESQTGGDAIYIDNNFSPFVSTTTTFYVEAVANGCATGTRTPVTATVYTAVTVSTNSTDVLCFGNNTGLAEVNILTGIEPFNYSWSNGGNGSIISNLYVGEYSYTVTDANGCTATGSVTINEPNQITATITAPPITTCSGECNTSVSLNATGGEPPYSYLWNDAANGQTSSIADGLCPGTYTVNITDANNCTVEISVPLIPVSSFDSQIFLTNIAAVDQNTVSTAFANYYAYDLPQTINPNPTNLRNFVDPGKYARFKVQARNQKDNGQSVVSGLCKVRTNSPYVVLTDSLSSLNNIGWDNQAWSGDEFEILIDNIAPPGNIYFDYVVVENQIEYITSCISIPLHPLVYDPHPATVDDDDNPDSQGNGNGIVEPNEIVEFYPWLQNISGMSADYVRGELENLDNLPFISIWDDVQGVNTIVYSATWWNFAFGEPTTIPIGANNMTPEFDFVFEVDQNMPIVDFPLYTVLSGGFELFNTDALTLVQWSLPHTFLTDVSLNTEEITDIQNHILISPNPTMGTYFVELSGEVFDIQSTFMEIYNASGIKVRTEHLSSPKNELNSEDLNTGIYLYIVRNKLGVLGTGKLMIIR